MTDTPPRATVQDAWRELYHLACAMRDDWNRQELSDSMYGAKTAGWPFDRVAREVWRLIWDPDGRPYELRNSVRLARAGTRTNPEDTANGRAAVRAVLDQIRNRGTGPQRAAS